MWRKASQFFLHTSSSQLVISNDITYEIDKTSYEIKVILLITATFFAWYQRKKSVKQSTNALSLSFKEKGGFEVAKETKPRIFSHIENIFASDQ